MQLRFACCVSILLIGCGLSAVDSVAGENAVGRLVPAVSDADYYDNGSPDDAKVALGAQLFFDKILSGNRNISCATCHHPFAATGDGLAVSIGEGGRGLGVTRDTGGGDSAIRERVPRNAPALFNLGATEFATLFHDGRIQPNALMPSGIESPARMDLPERLDNVLAAQAMFPVTSATEMAGQPGENPVADSAAMGDLAGVNGVWAQLADRLRAIDGYAAQFVAVFEDVSSPADIRFEHAANAIAAFEAVNWRSDHSPFDRFLRRQPGAMSQNQLRGMRIFYSRSRGNCASCHAGRFQTDHSFRAIAMPQIGPGKGDGPQGYEDFGRERVTGHRGDRYKFRVPSLRNIALTAPYGHDGAYDDLEAMVRHHLDAVQSLYAYDEKLAILPSRADLDAMDFLAMSNPDVLAAIADANEIPARSLNDQEIDLLVEFLHALTDPSMQDLRRDVPVQLPSGLSVRD